MKSTEQSEHDETEAEWIKTAGINSNIQHFPENHEEVFTSGHVLLLDIEMDETGLEEVKEILRLTKGVSFIFSSSKHGFHVWNPIIRSLTEIKEIMEGMEFVDNDYIDAGFDKGSYTLRVANKGDKPRPEPLDVVYGKNHMLQTYSRPHLAYLSERGFEEAENVLDNCYCTGDTLPLAKYHTRANNHELEEVERDNNG